MKFIMKGKKEVRIHTVLSNGQVASMYFVVDRNQSFTDGYDYDCWRVGLRIGNTRRDNNDWFTGDKVHSMTVSTGRCGLEGLMWAKRVLESFTTQLRKNECQMMVIGAEDDKRHRAYSRLLKQGYTQGTYNNESVYMLEF